MCVSVRVYECVCEYVCVDESVCVRVRQLARAINKRGLEKDDEAVLMPRP